MKKLSLLLTLLFAGCASPTVKAPWRTFPGARIKDECAKYAKAAEADLTKRRVPAYYTEYDWCSAGTTGCHAVTLFKDEKGWWLVDNVMAYPYRVKGGTVLEMLKSYDRDAYLVWTASHIPVPLD